MSNLIMPEFVPETFENKWVELDNEVYHSDKTAVNSSSLRKMIESPMAYYDSYLNSAKPTKAMNFGKLAHMAILEGDKFKEKYLVEPIFEGLTKDGRMSSQSASAKAKKAEWYDSLQPGCVVVTQEEFDDLLRMIDSIINHPVAFPILSKGKSEIKGYYRDPSTGLKCRVMIDFTSFDLNTLIDFKTTSDIRWPKFRRSVEDLQYPFQMAMYRKAMELISGRLPDCDAWISIQSSSPFEVMVHEVSKEYQIIGDYEYERCIKLLAQCINNKKFPPAQTVCEFGEPSSWYLQEYSMKGVLV